MKDKSPNGRNVHQLFESQVEQRSESTAVIDDGYRLSYQEINGKANQLAAFLRRQGVGPEALVGLCVNRSADMIVGLMAVLKAGGAYVPLDPEFPLGRLQYMLSDSGARILLTQQGLLPRLPSFSGNLFCIDRDWASVQGESTSNVRSGVVPRNLAYVIYTSGSTGQPKGVMVEHQNLASTITALGEDVRIQANERILAVASPSSDIAGVEIFLPLTTGGLVEIIRGRRGEFAEQVNKSSATLIQASPSAWQLLLASGWKGNLGVKALCGGEPLSKELADQLTPLVGKLWNHYGPTETTMVSTSSAVERGKPITIGRPLANSRAYILDPAGQPVPHGAVGELCLGGQGVARGYLHRPGLTAERFLPDPFGPAGGRLYRTGDVARQLVDGQIEYLGRNDHQVKIRGYRIELGEIEASLLEQPLVRQAVVTFENEAAVGGGSRLIAYIVTDPGVSISAIQLADRLGEKLPSYMVPNVFVPLTELPTNQIGKVDRTALPRVARGKSLPLGEYVSPQKFIERNLVDIWTTLLGLERVGVRDNFFELGGNSLLAVKLLARVSQEFRIDLPVSAVFDNPTISKLAPVVEAQHDLRQRPTRGSGSIRTSSLSYGQRRLWFLQNLQPESPYYNVSVPYRIVGELDRARLADALHAVIHRHGVLRSRFKTEGGEPIAEIAPFLRIELPVFDAMPLNLRARTKMIRAITHQESQRSFDLECGPLIRAALIRVHATDHILVITLHHIVSDAWSAGLLCDGIADAYKESPAGDRAGVASPQLQYSYFAAWQQELVESGQLKHQLNYWLAKLRGLPELCTLPSSKPRTIRQGFEGAGIRFRFSPSLVEGLKTLGSRHGASLFMIMLAAFKAVVHRYSASNDVVVGTAVANRKLIEFEGMIGFFVNTLVLRTDLSGRPTFETLLKRVRQTTLEAYDNMDYPFEKLVERLNPVRDLSRQAVFQLMFTFDTAPSLREAGEIRIQEGSEADVSASQFDLAIRLVEGRRGLRAIVEYDKELFDEAAVRRMWADYHQVLKGAVAQPESSVADLLPLRSEGELAPFDSQFRPFNVRTEYADVDEALKRFPSILECAVGMSEVDGTQQVTGYVVPIPGKAAPTALELRRFLAGRLPAHRIPSQFKVLAKLPTMAGGVDWNATIAEAAPVVEPQGYVAPRNKTEKALAEIWRELLGVEVVGVHDNFFELGGHSLLAMRVVKRAEQRGIHFRVADIFMQRDLAGLAREVDEAPD